MKVTKGKIEGVFIFEPTVHGDDRGFFLESYNKSTFKNLTGLDVDFVQDNQSRSKKGTLRGLHYQSGAHAQAKLVRVLQGKVLDVYVDLRPESPTFGQWDSHILTGENQVQLFVPRGLAHGFATLSDSVDFFYKCDNYYNKESEGGIHFADEELNIDWQLGETTPIISEKDLALPTFRSYVDSLKD
ncbi:dTDP-4-dehydrorhamnose 3,5-epimerase [Marinigracilibium pacificum]|uniref:dTDP-4-dehydrorhamnose 3,5-epimerase n=1 Tax=Marinigracilibium pacificum TaxID=2729599 RepID=A0A848J0M7_9BACT|nr:dTDP-4-dehydrorhamnose 3,5-epimerase [Marinigracilibium pacificum]NMM46802.1 dTDP-4-dehydrorhamnose 3,5-epimerase [Marinigracilibium pacificum]